MLKPIEKTASSFSCSSPKEYDKGNIKTNTNEQLFNFQSSVLGESLDEKAVAKEINYLTDHSENTSEQLYEATDEQESDLSASELKKELAETKSKQGLIGKLWDGFKNLTGIGAGSSKAEKAIEDFEKGKISQEEMNKAVNGYQEGQNMVVDIVADMASGLVAIGAAAAAPFTGGTSLLLAGAVGAGLKCAIKAADCIGNEKEYTLKNALYDIPTGFVNGLMGPLTNGLGGAAGTGVAKAFGLNALENTSKEALEQAAKQLGKEAIENTVKHSGKSFLTSLLAKGGTE